MAILKIGTETYNEKEHTVVLLTGRAIRDGEDATVNKPCARVSVAAKQEPDGSTLFVTVKGWRDRYRDVLRIRRGDQILAYGRYASREYNGKLYRDLDADFITISGGSYTGGDAYDPPHPRPAGAPVDVSADGFDEIEDNDEELPF